MEGTRIHKGSNCMDTQIVDHKKVETTHCQGGRLPSPLKMAHLSQNRIQGQTLAQNV